MTTRAMFRLVGIKQFAYSPSSREFTFSAEYDTSIPEEARFAKASPSGTLTIMVDNPVAIDALKMGQKYYLDFTEVPDPALVAATAVAADQAENPS